jgi:UPF0716 protein FxsA
MPLILLFLAIPVIEIALFIKVGGLVGLWPTLLIVLVTAVLGAYLVKLQGLRALNELRNSINQLNDPTRPLAHGAMILFAGALLLTPGFFTDTIGFLLLIPAVRLWVMRRIAARIKVATFTYGSQTPPRDDVVEGDFREVTQDQRPTHEPSGWTRH